MHDRILRIEVAARTRGQSRVQTAPVWCAHLADQLQSIREDVAKGYPLDDRHFEMLLESLEQMLGL